MTKRIDTKPQFVIGNKIKALWISVQLGIGTRSRLGLRRTLRQPGGQVVSRWGVPGNRPMPPVLETTSSSPGDFPVTMSNVTSAA